MGYYPLLLRSARLIPARCEEMHVASPVLRCATAPFF